MAPLLVYTRVGSVAISVYSVGFNQFFFQKSLFSVWFGFCSMHNNCQGGLVVLKYAGDAGAASCFLNHTDIAGLFN